MAQVCVGNEEHRDFPTVIARRVESPSQTLALFLTAPWHYQHGPTAAALLEKPPAKTISYFHGIPQEKSTVFMFPVTPFQLSHC